MQVNCQSTEPLGCLPLEAVESVTQLHHHILNVHHLHTTAAAIHLLTEGHSGMLNTTLVLG